MQTCCTYVRFGFIIFLVIGLASVYADDDDDDDDHHHSEVTDSDIPTSADIFYVRSKGSDSNTGLSPNDAFRTIHRAAVLAPAGSIIYVGAGTYTTGANFSGIESTSSWPLRIVADTTGSKTGDRGPVILGPGAAITILRCDHVRVSGFTFQNPVDRCFVWRRSTHGLVQDCDFLGGSKGVKIRSGDVEFQGCTVRDFAGNGIDVYGTAELYLNDCTIENCGNTGLSINRYARVTVDSSEFLNNTGDGLAVNDITSTDDGTVGNIPKNLLQQARDLLAATMASAPKKGREKIEDSVSKLDVALEPEYWHDPWHPHSKLTKNVAKSKGLTADEGKDVFKKTKEALDKLKDFVKNDPKKDAELGNKGNVKTNVNLAHAWLLEATETMARLALEEALLVNSDSKSISKYYKEYKKAVKELDKGHYHHAAEKYGKAWEDAAEAAGSGYASLNGLGTDNDNPSDADAKKYLTISGSSFESNAHGIRCATPQVFAMRASELSHNSQSGLYLVGGGQVEDCILTGNSSGVHLNEVTSLSSIKQLTISDNLLYGLYAENCDLAFNMVNMSDWQISGSPYVIAAQESDISIENVTIRGGTVVGVLCSGGKMRASHVTFTDNGAGLSLEGGDFTLDDCILSGNTVGLDAANCRSLLIRNNQLNDNAEWGVKLSGRGSLVDTAIHGNGTGGIELTKMTSTDLSLTRTTLSDNTDYGLYCNDSTMTFDASLLSGLTVSGSKTVFAGFESALTFNGVTISGGSQFGIANYGGTLTINDCTLSGNGIGLYSEDTCSANSSRFTENTVAGARVLGAAAFTNCVLEKNPVGLQINNDTTNAVKLVTSKIQDNSIYGVWCDSCTTSFDSTMQADWSVRNNGSNFGGTGSTLTFDGFTISQGTTYGVVSEKGTLNLTNSVLTSNGTGAYIDVNSTLNASGTKFNGNTLYGAALRGKATAHNCEFNSNSHGLHLGNMTDGGFDGTGSMASNNTHAGVLLESCSLALTGAGINGLTLLDNLYGIYSVNSTLIFDNFTSTSNTYGAWLTSSDVTMSNSTFTGSSYGLWATNNSTLAVDSCTFTGNASYGAYLEGNGSIHNSSITGNGNGLYINSRNLTDAALMGTDISGNTTYGVYVYNGSLNLSSQATEGWIIDGNGYNIATYQTDISLTGATLTNATECGVYAQYGRVDVEQSTITSESSGVWGLNNNGMAIDRSIISGSSTNGWGILNQEGRLTLRNSVVSGAQYGVCSYGPGASSTIYNSTISDASLSGVYVDDGDHTVKNTIISGTNGTYGLFRGPNASLTHSHNLVSGFSFAFENTAADSTEVLKPPRFVDAVNGDFRLAKGSPAINAGDDLTLSHTVDLSGNTRPSHKVFEIGAYEFMSDDGAFRVIQWQETK